MRDGECVVIYPEGTLTRDPELWPMAGKSGAARIALATGCPVIPVGQWGAQEILPPYAKTPDLFPRKHLTLKAGDPVPLDDLLAQPTTPEVVDQATAADHGGDHRRSWPSCGARPPPTARFDQRESGRHQIGNPAHEGQEEAMTHAPTKVAVFSAGSWGTAFSIVLADAGNDVTLWARRQELADAINQSHENPDYQPGIQLPPARLGDPRRRGGPRRRRGRRPRDALADVARQPRAVGAVHPEPTR